MDLKIALLTIGTELTEGIVKDTNSYYLSKELFENGYSVTKHVSVPDSLEAIVKEIKQLVTEFHIIIATGGLGPTQDDLTREAISKAYGKELEISTKYYEIAKENHPKNGAKRLASFPKDAQLIEPGQYGAAGFLLKENQKIIISLPGVPKELEMMLKKSVLKIISEFEKGLGQPKEFIRRRIFKFVNLRETQIEEKLKLIDGKLNYGILPKLGEVHLYLSVKSENESETQSRLEQLDERVEELFNDNLFAKDDETLEQVIVRDLSSKKLLLSVAESSTGGLIGHRITNVKDSSIIFPGGFIAYSNELKEEIGVNKEVMVSKGAVSKEVAAQMAEATLKMTKSDISVSVTGIAGPTGATKEKPLGLHYIGLAKKGKETKVKKFVFRGDREQNQLLASQEALVMVRESYL
ncbi:MAG: nicotinamide-nucleotide amidohydrolase family protein [Actinobacteria bacterium]|nr:MAG: nicotinamide-nucleotide amidohydrolase family protein [Actinomycetota bacterium]